MKDVDASSWEADVKNHDGPVLVDFYADWCGPCKTLGALLVKFEDIFINIKMVKVDVDANLGLASTHNVRSVPTLMMFKKGEVSGHSVGTLDQHALKKFIQMYA